MTLLKELRQWRFSKAEPYGMMMFFDPSLEQPILRGLTVEEQKDYLDSVSSVSALGRPDEEEEQLCLE